MLEKNSDLYCAETASCSAFSSTRRLGELDLLALVLDLDVLLGQTARLLVGAAQLLLAGLQLLRLRLRLLEQVRAISDVATAVTEGDLTRQVGVQARGEVAVLKDKLNETIRNLRETTRQNTEQDWLKTNLARFTRMLQGQRDLATVSSMILSELAPLVSAQHGVFYTLASLEESDEPVLRYQAAYGYKERKHLANHFRLGEGLVGQCALEKQRILLTDVPGDYVRVNSGLGEFPPLNIIVLPILFEGTVRAVVELASFSRFSATHQAFLDQLTESIGLVLNTIEANTLTETLIGQVGRKLVDVVGEVLPNTGDLRGLGLAAELSLDPDLAGHPGHLRGEPIELIDHRVDRVLQLEELALDIGGDLLAQVTVGHRRSHFCNVAHLSGEVARHQVDVVGQVLPDAADLDRDGCRLAKLALGPDLAGHASQLRDEPVELVHHRVDRVLELQHLAVDVRGDLLAQVSAGDRADDALHLDRGAHEVVDQAVDRLDALRPHPV